MIFSLQIPESYIASVFNGLFLFLAEHKSLYGVIPIKVMCLGKEDRNERKSAVYTGQIL